MGAPDQLHTDGNSHLYQSTAELDAWLTAIELRLANRQTLQTQQVVVVAMATGTPASIDLQPPQRGAVWRRVSRLSAARFGAV